ncbi:MAG: immunoglobulin-like domain-containing protein [Candidatus Izemoplasmatales bacterium]
MKKICLSLFLLLMILSLAACTTVDESDVSIVLNPGVDTVEINTEYKDPGATSKAYGFIIKNEVISNTVDTSVLGSYTIIYQVDYRNVIKTMTRVVSVVDETAPTGTLNPGIDTVSIGSSWVDASVSAQDNSGETVTIETIGTVNTNIEGDYIITYLLSDSSGNISELIRYVFVIKAD